MGLGSSNTSVRLDKCCNEGFQSLTNQCFATSISYRILSQIVGEDDFITNLLKQLAEQIGVLANDLVNFLIKHNIDFTFKDPGLPKWSHGQ